MEKLFKIDNTKGIYKKGQADDMIPVVTNSSKNNGITKYQNREATEEGGIITYSDTTTTDAIFYQPSPFAGFSHVKKMTPINREKWNESCCLFFISALKHQISGDFDYAHKLNKMGEIEVPLPTRNSKIDFDYMDAYIQEMKRTHVRMLKDCFDATLKQYKNIISFKEDMSEFTDIEKIKTETKVGNDTKILVLPEYHDGCIPLYSMRAACGVLDTNDKSYNEDPEKEGWVDVSGHGFTPNKDRYFAVYAKGDSMLPIIKDGDICIFEWYNNGCGGTRNGKIVLIYAKDEKFADDWEFTIKEYHSEKVLDEDGWQHNRIVLKPLNTKYKAFEVTEEQQPRTIGVLKCVL